jgi:nicotinamide mononucleotide transporter
MTTTTTLEYIAVATGLLSVWYSKKENIWVYPTGIVSVVIYVYLCYVGKLYAESFINFYYFIMSLYGWYNWSKITPAHATQPLTITKNTHQTNLLLLLTTAAVWAGLAAVLIAFTDSTVPYVDALATAVFFVAMGLMAHKRIENWLYWIVGDLLCIPLYAYKGYTATSIQYAIFTVLAVMGYIDWKNKMTQANKNLAA